MSSIYKKKGEREERRKKNEEEGRRKKGIEGERIENLTLFDS